MRQWIVLLLLAAISGAHAHVYDVVAVQGGGSIEGTVRLVGKPPEPQRLTITKDQQFCGKGVRLVGEVSIDSAGSITGAVVYIDRIGAGKAWPTSKDGFVIDQKGCRFALSSRVMRNGDTVKLKNSDKTLHNIHAYEIIEGVSRTMFNMATAPGTELKRKLDMDEGNEMKLACDVHNFMHERLLVLDHPYFSETSKGGKFSIGDIPPGTYKLAAWHPALGRQEATIEVTSGKKTTLDFTFKGK